MIKKFITTTYYVITCKDNKIEITPTKINYKQIKEISKIDHNTTSFISRIKDIRYSLANYILILKDGTRLFCR